MNEQDEKLLERYLDYIRKRNKTIVFIIIFILFLASIGFYIGYSKYKKNIKDTNSFVQQESENNVINQNTIDGKSIENNINIVSNENTKEENKTKEIPNDKITTNTKEESTNQETKVEDKENISTSNEKDNNKPKDTNDKPKNKDFLFINGYTMDNVTQAAQDYLKSYNYSGECVPIKDDEGIYLGMRVIFY